MGDLASDHAAPDTSVRRQIGVLLAIPARGLPIDPLIGVLRELAFEQVAGAVISQPHYRRVVATVGSLMGRPKNAEIAVGHHHRTRWKLAHGYSSQLLLAHCLVAVHRSPTRRHGNPANNIMRHYDPHHGPVSRA